MKYTSNWIDVCCHRQSENNMTLSNAQTHVSTDFRHLNVSYNLCFELSANTVDTFI